jgi:hypothetical protein
MSRPLVWKPFHNRPGCKYADAGIHGRYTIERRGRRFDLRANGTLIGDFSNMVEAEERARQEHRERVGRRSA